MSDNKNHNDFSPIRVIAECAILIAIGTILAQIKIYRMPNGGSVTAASMVPFLLVGYRHGVRWGLVAGFANALLQLLIGGVYPPVAPGVYSYVLEILLDYILSYMSLALSGVFFRPFRQKNKKYLNELGAEESVEKRTKNSYLGLVFSSAMCCFIRFLCSFVSGFVVWADLTGQGLVAVSYSFAYNIAYLLPESVITVIVLLLLFRFAPKLFYKSAYNML